MMAHSRGICPFKTCQEENVVANHYLGKHSINIDRHFIRVKSSGEDKRCCLDHREARVNGPHEAMSHLIENHPTLFLPESRDIASRVSENEEEIDSIWVFANATEAETRRLEVEKDDLVEKLRVAIESSIKLELRVAELMDSNFKLEQKNLKINEENSRLVGDNKRMNTEMLSIRNGARSADDFRATYGEMQGKRG